MKKTYLKPLVEFELFKLSDVMGVSSYNENDGVNIGVDDGLIDLGALSTGGDVL